MTAFPTAPSVPDAPPAPETFIHSPPARPAGSYRRSSWAVRLVRGRDDDAAWVRPALLALLAGTGVLYLWNLAASGWGNAFYAAAAQAGSNNWEALFYGSSDAANSITVDKPPAALWVMSLSVRLFGLSSWSILAPEALMGVATVGFLYLSVRRIAGPAAALLAGAATALTPVAVLLFRFDNPDALLVLLLTAAAYAVTRATEAAGGRWLALAGVLAGLGFLTKMLQALLVLPAFALVYLLAAPAPFRRRVLHVLTSGLALVATAGWWVLTVELVPASWRPYIGGSQTNSVWELIWGYNGLGRLTGNETGSVGGGGTGGPQGPGGAGGGGWGATGLGRMFGAEVGGQVAWLLPAALFLLVTGLVAVGRAPRTDRRRAGLLLWGGWLIVTALVFSLMAGIFHAYYTVALAPAIGAVVGIGGALLWGRRTHLGARIALATAVGGTVVWSAVLLARSGTFLPWLRPLVLVVGIAAASGLLAVHRLGRHVVTVVLTAGILAGLGGSAAYAVQTAGIPHTGSIPSAGPTVAGANGFGGPGGGPGRGFPGGGFPGGHARGGFPGTHVRGGFPGANGGFPGGPPGGRGGFGGGRGGMGGLLDAASVSSATATALEQDASSYTWVAATVGANNAAGYQLATQLPVMPIGGFNGSDPSPTLAQFQAYVAAGKIHWFIGGGGFGGSAGGSNASSSIASWVASTYTAQTIGGVTMYDLTSPAG